MSLSQVVLGVLTLIACGYTVIGYPNKYGALSGRSRMFRTIGLCMLDLLLLLVLMATFTDFRAGVSKSVAAIRLFFYVASCFFLCFALIAVAALDALESYSAVRRERRNEMSRSLSAEISKAHVESAMTASPAAPTELVGSPDGVADGGNHNSG